MSKASFKHYFKPTPKRFRILGDSLASASVLVSGYALYEGMREVAFFVIVSGWVGKFITNFFTDSK
jgi:hypothetical protein